MRKIDEMLRLYAVTDRAWTGRQTLFEQVEAALKGGVTCVQLREKGMEYPELLDAARELKKLCRKYDVPLIINDYVEIALLSGADGVHVGQEDAPVHQVRKQAGDRLIIGATAKTVEAARQAERDGADYLGSGAIFGTTTKKTRSMTREELTAIVRAVTIPVVAIGGINRQNLPLLKGSGVSGAAIVSGIFAADDIEAECRQLRLLADELKG